MGKFEKNEKIQNLETSHEIRLLECSTSPPGGDQVDGSPPVPSDMVAGGLVGIAKINDKLSGILY